MAGGRLMWGLTVLCLLPVALCGWVDLFKFPWKGLTLEIAFTLSCPSEDACYVAGSTGNSFFTVYIAEKGNFHSLQESNFKKGHPLAILDMAMYPGTTKGIVVGVGALKDSGVFYTKDGKNWDSSLDLDLMQASAAAYISEKEFVYMGDPNTFNNNPGVGVSKDGGYVWKGEFMNITQLGMPLGVSIANGAFLSSDHWIIAAGTAPGKNSSVNYDDMVKVGLRSYYNPTTKSLHVDGRAQMEGAEFPMPPFPTFPQPPEPPMPVAPQPHPIPPPPPPSPQFYTAFIVTTTDAGKTWTSVFHNMGKWTFDDIFCVNATYCVATAFSDAGPKTNTPGARILVTQDGGKSWDQKLLISGNPFQALGKIRMPGPNDMWVCGSVIKSGIENHAVFYHSKDMGNTWTLEGTISGIEDVFDMSFVSPTLGYATALTETHFTTYLKFTA